MRQIGLSDLDLAARAVMRAPYQRAWFAADLIEAAHSADKVCKRTGRAHPSGGTGSLYAQAALHPLAPREVCGADYLAALSVLLEALVAWRARMDHAS